MPLSYAIYYHILSVSSPLSVSNLFLLSRIHYLLLAETQLFAWLITKVLKNKKALWLARNQSHSLTRGMTCSLFLSFSSPLFLLHTCLIPLCGLPTLFSPGCNYHGPQFLFSFYFSSLPPSFFHSKPLLSPHSYRS